MNFLSSYANDLNDVPLYSIDLEPEDFRQGMTISQLPLSEPAQWQAYLNALGLFSFSRWLEAQLPNRSIQQDTHTIECMGKLEICGFKLGLIAAEHILDETVYIPRSAIEQADMQSHFYVLLEVLEEQERSIIRGFLRHDRLVETVNRLQQPATSEVYSLPLSILEVEANHLVAYCRLLSPSAIPLSNLLDCNSLLTADTVALNTTREPIRTKLSQWLEGILGEGWQLIEALTSPEFALALSTRNLTGGTRRGKLIDLGVQLGNQQVALLITITPEVDNKLAVVIQVHPMGLVKALPPGLKLSLVSKTGQVHREVEARQNDNYIQLPALKGKIGTQFSVQLNLNSMLLSEEFEL
jgi:hypothetical protein